MPFNLADLFEHVADHVGGREAVVCGDARRDYATLDERTTRLAHALRDLGVAPGAHVGLFLHDSVEHVEAMLACYKARAVPVNVNHRYLGDELAHLCADAGLVGLVADRDLRAPAVDLARRGVALDWVVEVDGGAASAPGDRRELDAVPGTIRFEDLVASGTAARDLGPRSADDHYVLYTGGTTGMPKGVVWRHEDIFFAVLGGGNPGGPPIERPEQIGPRAVENRAQRLRPYLPAGDPGPDRFVQLALGPLMHASGQWSALGTLLAGGTVVLYPERHMDLGRVLGIVEHERVVGLNLVGDTSARPLLDVVEARPDAYDTSSLRLLGSGGSILSGDVKERLLAALPTVLAITEAIGSSESPAQGVAIVRRGGGPVPSLRFAPKAGTIVVDDDLQPIAAGSGRVGRLATPGRVPLGYHGDPDKTARTFPTIDGVRYALPGDMATVEADGTIVLLGRGALCVNTGGEKVYPEEVEAVLAAHPDVADALVVGVPDERYGQRVVAVVEPADPSRPPTLDALRAHCRERLANYKAPRDLRIVDRVVRSAAGKADYRWAAEVAAAPASERSGSARLGDRAVAVSRPPQGPPAARPRP